MDFLKAKIKKPETIVIDIQKDIEMLDKIYSGINENYPYPVINRNGYHERCPYCRNRLFGNKDYIYCSICEYRWKYDLMEVSE